MERIMSQEERIRRAEEIYYRRQNQGVRVSTSSVNTSKSNKVSLGKKMCIQIIFCLIIYLAFYIIKGYNNIFSQNVINTTKNILSYDVNLQNLYNQSMEYFNKNFNNIIPTGITQNDIQDVENSDGNHGKNSGENSR